jgi:hypothetical protein
MRLKKGSALIMVLCAMVFIGIYVIHALESSFQFRTFARNRALILQQKQLVRTGLDIGYALLKAQAPDRTEPTFFHYTYRPNPQYPSYDIAVQAETGVDSHTVTSRLFCDGICIEARSFTVSRPDIQ